MNFRDSINLENAAMGLGRLVASFVLFGAVACDDPGATQDAATPAGVGGKADDAEGESKLYDVEHGDYVLEVAVRPDQSALDVRVDDWQFVVPWDGQTARCPCRTYASSILTLELSALSDGFDVVVLDARLGLEASIEERDGNFYIVLADGRPPKVGDYLALLAVADTNDRALLDRIAETDLEAYLQTVDPRSDIDLFWDDVEELSIVADWLTRRVYQPSGQG